MAIGGLVFGAYDAHAERSLQSKLAEAERKHQEAMAEADHTHQRQLSHDDRTFEARRDTYLDALMFSGPHDVHGAGGRTQDLSVPTGTPNRCAATW